MDIVGYFSNLNLGCHGIPERCLSVRGKRMKICARCYGCVIGHILAFILMFLNLLPIWYISLGLLIIMYIDWSLQQFLNIMSNNMRRLITGLLGGLGIGSLIWTFVLFLIKFIVK
jgi:uncharacterized membrane protein